MINRLVFVMIFAALGALAYGWWRNDQRIVAAHQEKIQAFIDAGPRFTARDGQALCEALVEVAKHSIGFQQSGKLMPNCNYGDKR